MARKKLKRFAENATMNNVFQPAIDGVKRAGTWASSFGNDHPIVVEIGCGKGEYTLALARTFPEANYIGMDKKGERIWRGAKTALEEGMDHVGFLRGRVENLNQDFAENEVSEIWITFPGPFPKERQERFRLTAPHFLAMYKKIVQPSGVVHLKTDSQELFTYSCETVTASGATITAQSRDIDTDFPENETLAIQTAFERKWRAQEKPIAYLQWRWD